MKYQDYQFQDFMMDEGFQQWVLQPDPGTDRFWRNWIAQHPEQATDIRKAGQAIRELYLVGARKEQGRPRGERESPASPALAAQQQAWHLIRQALDAEAAAPATEARTTSIRPLWPASRWRGLAAAVLLLLTLGLLAWLRQHHAARAVIVQETAFGKTRLVTLPDSSRVFLNANSRLSYQAGGAAGADREVTLVGEAFFAVPRQKTPRRFRVNLQDGAAVEVLGTTFTVTNRPSLTRVVLNEGQVKVAVGGVKPAAALLAPGDLVEIDRRESRLAKTRVPRPQDYAAFVQNKIEFSDSPLSEVARVLQDHYGYQVRFMPATLAQKRLTSSSPGNRVDLLLFAIEKSFNLQVIRKGRQITIRETE